MSVLTINSKRLNRIVRVCVSKDEARRVWQEHPEDRGGIYLAEEVRPMGGISDEALQAIQMVKDAFPGATIQGFSPLEEQQS